ncbi:hypothetical protein [Devosia sp. 66-22]|uniref:hypothetical protein n=1 Tax=Devosia sp. 66-22 TaxID=1895753 RepID=UPI00092ADBF3|nr:hypothetical protein [Devosia sp. 66-22]OJX48977.1 MAG: hypothetical protein BGO81_10305 [Devosia sp. 66-22]
MVRTFATGATRDVDASKLDYEGFFSPLVMERFAQYMHGKRKLADGSLRDGDNWQKGMPRDSYMKSGFRHFFDWWTIHRGWKKIALEPLEVALCGLLFNVSGYLHEVIKSRLDAEAWVEAVRDEVAREQAAREGGEQLELPLTGGADLRGLAAREAGDTTFVGQVGPAGLSAVRGREGE